jgi:hypothetical protein
MRERRVDRKRIAAAPACAGGIADRFSHARQGLCGASLQPARFGT